MEYVFTIPLEFTFFDTISYCTVHLFWMANVSTILQQRFLHFIVTTHQPNNTFIHSENLKQFIKDENNVHIELSTQNVIRTISRLYSKELQSSKYNTVCKLSTTSCTKWHSAKTY